MIYDNKRSEPRYPTNVASISKYERFFTKDFKRS